MMARTEWWSLSDDALSGQCIEDRYRASGPGGQKRNKTESAVRLRHQATGIVVTASESRSQHDNRRRALRRMREALTLQQRQASGDCPEYVTHACVDGAIRIGRKDPSYLGVVAFILDLLEESEGAVVPVTITLQVSTASLTRFLRSSDSCWQAVQQIRQSHGKSPLR